MTMTMRLLIAGGGTGGHLFPGLAIARAFEQRFADCAVLFVGTEHGLESRLVPERGYPLAFVPFARLKNTGAREKLRNLARVPGSLLESRRILKRFGPRIVIGVGGYASGPMVLAAALRGLPTAICEQNSVPGLTNRILARVTKRIFTAFEAAGAHFPAKKVRLVGNPVREDLAGRTTRRPGEGDRRSLLVLGGSQGARFLNEQVPVLLDALRQQAPEATFSVRHQAGKGNGEAVQQRYAALGFEARVDEFIDDMPGAYDEADFVICRAGALTISELAVSGRPALFVPFPYAADDHQSKNAQAMVDAGAALMVQQVQFEERRLATELAGLLWPGARLGEMSERARGLGKPHAVDAIVDGCLELLA